MEKIQSTANWQDKSCTQCADLLACRTQVVVASPCPPGGLLAIGEAPGCDEDRKGEGFIGIAGRKLDALLGANGVGRQAYGRANICRCRPPDNRKPAANEVRSCLPYLANLIQEIRPKVILAVGGTPTSVLCGSGTLYSKINARQESGDWSAGPSMRLAHLEIRGALEGVSFVVPMPHSSPLALNRNAPSGVKWEEIAKHQVALAVGLLK